MIFDPLNYANSSIIIRVHINNRITFGMKWGDVGLPVFVQTVPRKNLAIVHEKDEPLFAALEGNALLERRQREWRLLMIGLQERIKAC